MVSDTFSAVGLVPRGHDRVPADDARPRPVDAAFDPIPLNEPQITASQALLAPSPPREGGLGRGGGAGLMAWFADSGRMDYPSPYPLPQGERMNEVLSFHNFTVHSTVLARAIAPPRRREGATHGLVTSFNAVGPFCCCMLSSDRDHSPFVLASASWRSRSTASSSSLPLRFLYRMIPFRSIT